MSHPSETLPASKGEKGTPTPKRPSLFDNQPEATKPESASVSPTATPPINTASIAPAHSTKPAVDDPFDPKRLRLSQGFSAAVGLRKLLTVVPVKKPSREWFVRVHPNVDYRLDTAVVELKEDRETYLVSPELWPELAGEPTFSPRLLVTAINRQGTLFIWPIRLPGEDGKLDSWSQSSLDAVKAAETDWIRVSANMNMGAYDITVASLQDQPRWAEHPFGEIIKVAFKGKLIDDLNHPVLQRLRGEI